MISGAIDGDPGQHRPEKHCGLIDELQDRVRLLQTVRRSYRRNRGVKRRRDQRAGSAEKNREYENRFYLNQVLQIKDEIKRQQSAQGCGPRPEDFEGAEFID